MDRLCEAAKTTIDQSLISHHSNSMYVQLGVSTTYLLEDSGCHAVLSLKLGLAHLHVVLTSGHDDFS